MSQVTIEEPGRPYDRRFYDARRSGSRRSAEALLPPVLDLVAPRSVVDVGCATGGWLAVAKRHGVTDVLGIDLERVPEELLEISPEEFLARNLCEPLNLDRRFDLVLALEVGEHLPAASAETFLDSVVGLGPVVLFSAAIPRQGGTDHLNEQWQDYWIERFAARQYQAIDCVRPAVWTDRRVWPHYAQNTFLYVSRAHLERHARLASLAAQPGLPARLVHPGVYFMVTDQLKQPAAGDAGAIGSARNPQEADAWNKTTMTSGTTRS